jgi:hypothetical protein
MSTMGDSIGTAIDSLKDIISESNDKQKAQWEIATQAMKAIEKNEGLCSEDFSYVAMAIGDRPSYANIYLSIREKQECLSYILRLLEKAKKE